MPLLRATDRPFSTPGVVPQCTGVSRSKPADTYLALNSGVRGKPKASPRVEMGRLSRIGSSPEFRLSASFWDIRPATIVNASAMPASTADSPKQLIAVIPCASDQLKCNMARAFLEDAARIPARASTPLFASHTSVRSNPRLSKRVLDDFPQHGRVIHNENPKLLHIYSPVFFSPRPFAAWKRYRQLRRRNGAPTRCFGQSRY